MTPAVDLARLRSNAESVRRRVAAACARAGRAPSSVTIVAVTKSVGPGLAAALYDLGFHDLGENRAVEAAEKIAGVGRPARWHFIGHLQTNKAGKVVGRFGTIHSVDRRELAETLEKRLAADNLRMPGFVQVNVSGESTKGGMKPEEASAFVAWMRKSCPHLEPVGLMTMAPVGTTPEEARPHFRRLRDLAAAAGVPGLSMGMTGDFEAAVEEGATHIRVGSAFFGGVE